MGRLTPGMLLHNEWIDANVLEGDEQGKDFANKFWKSKPEPTSDSKADEDGCYKPGSMFVAPDKQRKRVRAAVGHPEARSQPRPPQTAPISTSQARKRRRSLSPENTSTIGRANRRREETPPAGEGYDPLLPEISAPRPMLRPVIGSVLTFKKGKVVVQDRHRKVLEARQFRARGGLFLQQHLRKEREQRLAAAKKRAEEAQAAAEEEARRIAEQLAEAEVLARAAEEAHIAEENARLEEANRAKAARAAEWSALQSEPPQPPSPPPLKALLGPSLDDELPDFEDDVEPAEAKASTTPPTNLFGVPNSLLSNQGDTKMPKKKKTDPFYWANKLAEERKQIELRSRHPILKLEVNETSIEVFMKDITNEPSRPPNAPGVSVFAGSIIDTSSTQEHVDDAITGIEQGWLPSGSIARLAPVDKVHWAILEVLALQMFTDGKIILRPAVNPNVKIIGYVATKYTNKAQSTVQAEVDTYAQWGSAYRPTGIFYDEVLAQSSARSAYSAYTSYAKAKIPNAFVSLNPGTKPEDNQFYTFADQIMSVENYFNNFSPSLYTVGSSTPAAKQAFILTDSSSTVPTSVINQIIKTDKIGALYITDDVQANGQNPYDSFPTYWTGFLDAVQAAASQR
ncbi:unnamed protein product [Rhizoctonia solani]|uniref:Uncharacterized protein n=1 Tax=Rhizoctonia solani TaxID=456999 RepID=A0A8H3DKN5_9AGAM|nr:unnamed protein product [Rhizoctonia solani]